MEKLEVICNIPKENGGGSLLNLLCKLAEYKESKLIIHYCKSWQEVEFNVYTAEEKSVVLLQERLNGGVLYRARDPASLRDIRNIPVVFILDREHYGTEYMAVLYAAGILDAVYADDASPESLTERLLIRRQRKKCREYYGINSIEEVTKTLDIISQDILERYVRYICSGVDEENILLRYKEVEKRLSNAESNYLMKKLPDHVTTEIGYSHIVQKKEREKISVGRLVAERLKKRRGYCGDNAEKRK